MISKTFRESSILVAYVSSPETKKQRPLIFLSCLGFEDTSLDELSRLKIPNPDFQKIFSMKVIEKIDENNPVESREYILVGGNQSIYIVLHTSEGMHIVHCYENIHFSSVSSIEMDRFYLYSACPFEDKLHMIKIPVDRDLNQTKISVRNKLKNMHKLNLLTLGSRSKRSKRKGSLKVAARDINFNEFKVKRVDLNRISKKTKAYCSISVDVSFDESKVYVILDKELLVIENIFQEKPSVTNKGEVPGIYYNLKILKDFDFTAQELFSQNLEVFSPNCKRLRVEKGNADATLANKIEDAVKNFDKERNYLWNLNDTSFSFDGNYIIWNVGSGELGIVSTLKNIRVEKIPGFYHAKDEKLTVFCTTGDIFAMKFMAIVSEYDKDFVCGKAGVEDFDLKQRLIFAGRDMIEEQISIPLPDVNSRCKLSN